MRCVNFFYKCGCVNRCRINCFCKIDEIIVFPNPINNNLNFFN